MHNDAAMPKADDLITTDEARQLLGYARHSSVTRLVESGQLTPIRKLPGLRGAFVFARRDVERLAAKRTKAA